jgi:hypothetical protein
MLLMLIMTAFSIYVLFFLFFSSFFRAYVNFMNRHCSSWTYNAVRVQEEDSTVCGHHCIFYLVHRCAGKSMGDVYMFFFFFFFLLFFVNKMFFIIQALHYSKRQVHFLSFIDKFPVPVYHFW